MVFRLRCRLSETAGLSSSNWAGREASLKYMYGVASVEVIFKRRKMFFLLGLGTSELGGEVLGEVFCSAGN